VIGDNGLSLSRRFRLFTVFDWGSIGDPRDTDTNTIDCASLRPRLYDAHHAHFFWLHHAHFFEAGKNPAENTARFWRNFSEKIPAKFGRIFTLNSERKTRRNLKAILSVKPAYFWDKNPFEYLADSTA